MTNSYQDDSEITEITILPDGRVYVFGACEKIMAAMDVLQDSRADIVIQRDCIHRKPESQTKAVSGVIREQR